MRETTRDTILAMTGVWELSDKDLKAEPSKCFNQKCQAHTSNKGRNRESQKRNTVLEKKQKKNEMQILALKNTINTIKNVMDGLTSRMKEAGQ